MMDNEKYAIVDIGSNTVRLVIYNRNKSGRLTESENVKAVARLRNYLAESGDLRTEGIDVLIRTLRSFQEVTRHHQLQDVKCVATAAIRQARNQQQIVERVERETDFSMRILSEYEEAHYGYLAVVNSMPFENGITVDIGGGSTELTLFKDRKLINFHSFPFGALSLKQQFIKAELPEEAELAALRDFLKRQFETLPWLAGTGLPLIGIGGSARNMAQIHQEYVAYPLAGIHQYVIDAKDVHAIGSLLLSLNFESVQRLEGLSKDRADIIVPALEVFSALMDSTAARKFALSRKGLRDGVFYEELTKDFKLSVFPNVLEESFHELAIDYNINVKHAAHVSTNALMIARQLNEAGLLELREEDELFIRLGSSVYNLGAYIDAEASHQHSFYLLANRTIDGLLHKERMAVALIASYKNKDVFKRNAALYPVWFTKEELAKYSLYGAIVKMAYSLNATKRDIIETIRLEGTADALTFTVVCNSDWKPEQYEAEKQKKHMEKLLKKTVHFNFSES